MDDWREAQTTNGADIAAGPILACRPCRRLSGYLLGITPGQAPSRFPEVRTASRSADRAHGMQGAERAGRGDACRTPRVLHRGVLRIVMLVASDPAGFDLRLRAAFSCRRSSLLAGGPLAPAPPPCGIGSECFGPATSPPAGAHCWPFRSRCRLRWWLSVRSRLALQSPSAPGPASGPVRRGSDAKEHLPCSNLPHRRQRLAVP